MQNAGQKQLRLLGDYSHLSSRTHADARWIILMMFLLYSCHLIAPTLCLAQKSLIWIALYWNHIHIYNVEQLQLNFKLHCGKLCQSYWCLCNEVSLFRSAFCLLQVGLVSFWRCREKCAQRQRSSLSSVCHLASPERLTHCHTRHIRNIPLSLSLSCFTVSHAEDWGLIESLLNSRLALYPSDKVTLSV